MRAARSFVAVRSWLQERKRLYHEWERIREVEAQARTLVDELRRRRDGMPARTYDLWAIRESLAEVDEKDESNCSNCGHPISEHCHKHLIPCCPGKCELHIVTDRQED